MKKRTILRMTRVKRRTKKRYRKMTRTKITTMSRNAEHTGIDEGSAIRL